MPSEPSRAPQEASTDDGEGEDEREVPDLGEALGGLGGLLDPAMIRDAQWQNDKMKTFHRVYVPIFAWQLSAILAHARAQSDKLGLAADDVKEPSMGGALRAELEAMRARK